MNPETHLRLAGGLQIALALLHLAFPRRFGWKAELARLSPLNRQIFLVHTFYVCLVLVMIGSLSLCVPSALLEPTRLARLALAGFALFWAIRLLFQWTVYGSALWKGDRFNTAMHWIFTALWAYLTCVYAGAWYAISASG
jgi:hypothetical protein